MARRRHTPEQIVRKLREADRLLAEGKDVAEVARHLQVTEQTYHRWRNAVRRHEGRRRQAAEGARDGEHAAEAASWRTRSSRTWRCGRSRRETGEPVEATSSRAHVAGTARHLAAAGVPDRRPAPLDPTPPAGRARSGSGPAASSCERSRGSIRGGAIGVRTPCWSVKATAATARRSSGLWREEGLRVPPKRRKRQRLGDLDHAGRPAPAPSGPITCGRSTTSSTSPPPAGPSRSCTSSTSSPASPSPIVVATPSTPTPPSTRSTRSSAARGTAPGVHPLRQRTRAHRQRPARLVPVLPRRRQLHRTRLALAEPLGRVLRLTHARRAARHRAVRHAPRSPSPRRRLARRVQHLPSPHRPRHAHPRRVRRPMEARKPPL